MQVRGASVRDAGDNILLHQRRHPARHAPFLGAVLTMSRYRFGRLPRPEDICPCGVRMQKDKDGNWSCKFCDRHNELTNELLGISKELEEGK